MEIKKEWLNSNFTGPEKLYLKLKGRYPRWEIRKRIESSTTYQLHKPSAKKFERQKIFLSGCNRLVDADLLEMRYKGDNNRKKYIFGAIDCFSRRAYTEAIGNKTAAETTKALKKIMSENPEFYPAVIRTDLGNEFKGDFEKFLTTKDIEHYTTADLNIKANYIERFCHTFRDKLRRSMTYRGSNKWINEYKNIVRDYNETPHSSLNDRPPISINDEEANSLMANVFIPQRIAKMVEMLRSKPKYKINDLVRIAIHKKHFDKSSEPVFTDEIYRVGDVRYTQPWMYSLSNLRGYPLSGSYYECEMQLADKGVDRKRVDKAVKTKEGDWRVSFKNWPSEFDEIWTAKKLKTYKND